MVKEIMQYHKILGTIAKKIHLNTVSRHWLILWVYLFLKTYTGIQSYWCENHLFYSSLQFRKRLYLSLRLQGFLWSVSSVIGV